MSDELLKRISSLEDEIQELKNRLGAGGSLNFQGSVTASRFNLTGPHGEMLAVLSAVESPDGSWCPQLVLRSDRQTEPAVFLGVGFQQVPGDDNRSLPLAFLKVGKTLSLESSDAVSAISIRSLPREISHGGLTMVGQEHLVDLEVAHTSSTTSISIGAKHLPTKIGIGGYAVPWRPSLWRQIWNRVFSTRVD